MEAKRGEFKVIRVDGTETIVPQKPTIQKLYKAIGCECGGTITLDRRNQVIMFVDDTGMVDRKPINEKATLLVRQAFRTQYPYSIHGDVAICNDEDFG